MDTLRTNLILTWSLDGLTLESRSAWMDSEQRLRQDTTQQFGFTAPSAGNSTDADYLFTYEQWQKELILRPADDGGRWNWLVGAQGFWEDASDTNRSRIWFRDPANTACGILSFGGRRIPCAFEDAVPLGKVISRDTTSYSLFGLVGLDLTERLTVTVEGRLISDEVEVSATTAASLADTLGPIFLLPPDYPGPPPAGEVDDTNFVPRISIDYRLGDNHLVYASAANGIKPPTFNVTDLQDPAINQVDKENLWSYELGAKTTWLDGSLLVNGAVYFNDYEDQQVLVQFQPSAGGLIPRSGTANASTVEIWGAELELGFDHESWSILAYAENVFDDDTVRYAQEFIDQQDGFVFGSGFAYPVAYYAYLPQPRTVGIRVLFRTP